MNRLATAWQCVLIGLLIEDGRIQAAPSSVRFPTAKVVVDAVPGTGSVNHGYTAHRFEIHNNSGKKQTVTLALPDKPESGEFTLQRISRTVTVSPRTSQTFQLLQPPLPMAGSMRNTVVITVGSTSKPLPNGFRPQFNGTAKNTGFNMPYTVLLSRSLNLTDYHDALVKLYGGPSSTHSHGPSSEDAEFETADLRPDKWPANWLAYTRYDFILMPPSDWRRAAPETQQALLRWVRCGGRLWFTEHDPDAYRGTGTWTQSKPHGEEFVLGWGEIWRPLQQENPDEMPTIMAKWVNTIGLRAGERSPKPMLADLRWGVEELHAEWHYRHHNPFHDSQSDFNEYFSVVSTSRVPVRLVVGLLTLFVFVAGPITLIILARKKRRIAYLWILPVMSFGFSGLVFFVSWFSEGVTPRVRLESITILDQVEKEATTIGATAVYAPLSPSKLLFDGASEITPLLDPNESDPGGNRRVEWSSGGGQSFTGNWVSSRIPTHFAVRKSTHTEKRLETTWGTDGTPEILNGLGGPLQQITVRRADGKLFTGQNISAGAKAKLKAAHSSSTGRPHTLTELIQLMAETGHSDVSLREKIPTGSYWAEMPHSPFLENPLEGRETILEAHAHVLGPLTDAGGTP